MLRTSRVIGSAFEGLEPLSFLRILNEENQNNIHFIVVFLKHLKNVTLHVGELLNKGLGPNVRLGRFKPAQAYDLNSKPLVHPDSFHPFKFLITTYPDFVNANFKILT